MANEYLGTGNDDGVVLGRSTSHKIGFYGLATPIVQPSVTWPNTGTQGTVNHSTTTTAGPARLVIRDNAGTVVYDETLVPSLNEATLVGVAGNWNVKLILTDYSGTLNFRVEKTT